MGDGMSDGGGDDDTEYDELSAAIMSNQESNEGSRQQQQQPERSNAHLGKSESAIQLGRGGKKNFGQSSRRKMNRTASHKVGIRQSEAPSSESGPDEG